MARLKSTDLTGSFDQTVYVLVKGEKDEGGFPVGVTRYYGSALSLAGEYGATGIHRTEEGVWEGTIDGCDKIWIYRMGVRNA